MSSPLQQGAGQQPQSWRDRLAPQEAHLATDRLKGGRIKCAFLGAPTCQLRCQTNQQHKEIHSLDSRCIYFPQQAKYEGCVHVQAETLKSRINSSDGVGELCLAFMGS